MAFSVSDYMKLREQRLSDITAQSGQHAATSVPADDFTSKYMALRQKRITKDIEAELQRIPSNINTQGEPQKSNRTWFNAGEFRDGYQFGDVTKTILGTGADIVEGLQAGILGAAEGVVDTGAYIAGGIGGFLGANDFKNDMGEFIKQDLIDEREIARKGNLMDVLLMSNGTNTDNSSLLGDKSDSLVQSGGQLLTTAGLQAVGVPWYVTTGLTSFGSEADNALNQGATFEQAGVSSAVSAGAEILTEKLFGGSGLGEKGLINLEPITKGISSKLVKALADFGIDMTSEGAEEVVSQFASNLGSKLYREENLNDILFSEEAIDGYIESFIAGAAMGGFANARKLSGSIKDARSNNPSPQQASFGADITQPAATQSQSPQSSLDDLIDESIARATNAPADPLGAAVEGCKATGTVTNKQAQDILNNTRAITSLLEQTGIKLPDTASGRRNAVKQAVAQLAQQAQSGSQADVLPGSEIDTSAQDAPAQEAPTAQPQTYTDKLLSEISGAKSNQQAVNTNNISGIKDQIRGRQDELNAMQPVADIQTPANYSQMDIASKKSWVIEKLRSTGFRVERKGFGIIDFAKKRLKSAFNYFDKGSAEEASFEAIPYVLENGVEISSHDQHKDREYGTVTIAAPVTINGKRGNMAVVVKQTTGNYYKVHRILTPDGSVFVLPETANEAESTPAGEAPETGSLATPKNSASENSISHPAENVNPTESVGAAPADFTGKAAYNDLLREGNVQPDRPGDVRPMEVPRTDSYGRHVSETAANLYGAEITTDETASRIEELIAMGALGFDTKTNKQMVEEAAAAIKKKGVAASEKAVTKAVFSGKAQDSDIVTAALLYTTYANRKGEAAQDKAAELAVDLATMANDAGRRLQLFKLIRKMTPQGQLMAVKKGVERSLERINKGRGKNNQTEVTIPQELVDEYLDAAQRDIQEQTEETAKQKEEIEQTIYKAAAAQIKASPMEKLNAWRYMAMLGNAKTQVRNIFGNAAFRPMTSVKRAVGAVIEHFAVEQENRTKAILGIGQDAKALLKWAQEDAKSQDAQQALSYSAQTGDAARDTIQNERQIFDTKWLETVRKTVQEVPEYFDMVFKNREYAYSLASFVKARGYTSADILAGNVSEDTLNAARSYATQEALKATFNDHNAVSDRLSNMRYKGSNSFWKAINILGEGVLPFRRTPANILVRGLEYSPVNVARSIWNLSTKVRSGEMSAATAIDQMASGLTGSAAAVLGYALAAGIFGIRLRGKIEDEDEKRMGHQEYALEIGDQSYTIDWLAPVNIPLFVGANIYETNQQGDINWLSSIFNACGSALEPMLELSCLSSLNDLVESAKYAEDGTALWSIAASAATSYITQFIPTLFGQVEQATELEKQSTYSSAATPVERSIEKTIGRMTQRIPGIDLFQAQKYDAWGNEIETSSAYQSFVNPAYKSQITNDPVDQEISRLNKAQSENVSPSLPEQSISYTGADGQSHKNQRLTTDEYEAMCRVQGQTQKRIIEDIISSADYAALSDEDKAKAISYAYDYARDTARIEVFDDYPGYSAKWMEQIDGNAVEIILRQAVVGTTEKYTDLPISAAAYTDELLKSLQKEIKEDGTSYPGIRDIQKMEAVVADDSLTAYTDALLRDIMPDSTEAKYDNALNKGFTAEQFVGGYRQYLDPTGEDKRLSVIRYCQREMGMSYAAAKKLYEIYSAKATKE